MASILLVDDSPDVRLLTRLSLERAGHVVHEAASGVQCVEFLRAHDAPDLVLLDVRMPGMTGWEALRLIREDERTATVPVVMLTAMMSPTDDVAGAELGVAGVVEKPFLEAELLAAIATAI